MFTEAEVERFYQSIVIKKPELSTSLTVDDLRFWYKGYEAHSGVKLYNPVSVSRALFYRRVNEYWTTTGGTSELESFIAKASKRARSDLVKLVKGAVGYLEIRMSSDEVHGFVTLRPYRKAEEIGKRVYALLITPDISASSQLGAHPVVSRFPTARFTSGSGSIGRTILGENYELSIQELRPRQYIVQLR